MNFTKNKLYEMAGYRNRLTHFYFEVTPKEMYKIIQNNLGDFDKFLKYIKKILEKKIFKLSINNESTTNLRIIFKVNAQFINSKRKGEKI